MKRISKYLFAAILIIIAASSCEQLPIESVNNKEEEKEKITGPQIITLDSIKGDWLSVQVSGKVNGLEAVALDFECGIEYSTDPSFSKDSTWRVKADVNYSENSYTVNISPVESGRNYYYRAYYINQLLIYFGVTKEFSFAWDNISLIGNWKANDGSYCVFNDD